MLPHMKRHVALLAAALSPACAPVFEAPTVVGPQAPYSVAGDHIVDATGATVLLRGVNLSQTAKQSPFHPEELASDEARAALRARGPLAIRYVTSWAAIEPEDGVFDEAWLTTMAGHLAALADDGHLIVLDLHQDLFGVGFTGGNGAPGFACDEAAYESHVYVEPWFNNYSSPKVQGCFDGLFGDDDKLRRMAAALRHAVDVAKGAAGAHLVGVDLINEPHPGSRDGPAFDALLHRYYGFAAAALDGTGVLPLFEPNVKHNLGEPSFLPGAPSSASVYAPHLYPFDVELGRYNDVNALRAQVQHFADEASGWGVPFVVGELGPKPGDAGAGLFVDDALAFLDEHLAGAFFWDWSAVSDRGFLRDDVGDVPLRALRPHARLIAGEVTLHRFDPVDGVFELELTGATGVSEIVWPTTWGELDVDFDVEADGVVAVDGGVIAWQPDASAATHRLVARRR